MEIICFPIKLEMRYEKALTRYLTIFGYGDTSDKEHPISPVAPESSIYIYSVTFLIGGNDIPSCIFLVQLVNDSIHELLKYMREFPYPYEEPTQYYKAYRLREAVLSQIPMENISIGN